jgi:antitoxin component of MazEF toxin-antitoxin module
MALLVRKTVSIQKIGEACGVLLPREEFPFLKTGDRVDVRIGEGRTIIVTLLGEDEPSGWASAARL